MRFEQLKSIISECVPELKCELKYQFDKYDSAEISLPDDGNISIGIDPKSRKIAFDFLYFNIRNSSIRLNVSDNYNGKYNYFGNEPERVLRELLAELKTKLK